MNKRELAEKYFKEGYNCAQSVALAFVEETGLEKDVLLKLASPFGGGMGRMREVCGAVSGMLIVFGCKFGYSDLKNDQVKMQTYAKVQALMGEFKAKNGSYVCRELLSLPGPEDPTPEKRTEGYYKKRPCASLVGDAAQILEDYFKNNADK